MGFLAFITVNSLAAGVCALIVDDRVNRSNRLGRSAGSLLTTVGWVAVAIGGVSGVIYFALASSANLQP